MDLLRVLKVPTDDELTFEELDIDVEHAIIEERNEHIKKLEKDLQDISEISSEINKLVYDQTEMLEEACDNVEVSEIYTNDAREELEEAYDNASKRRKFGIGITLGGGGVTAASVGVMFLNPIAGIIVAGVGVAGILFGIHNIKHF
jgi:hypothetical protein